MKTKFLGIIVIAIIALAIIGCKEDEPTPTPIPGDTPKVQLDTPRTLSFGTNYKVTIKSADIFTTAEWIMLCDKVVAAIGRMYSIAGGLQTNMETYFGGRTVIVILSKSQTLRCEVKDTAPGVIYFKADAAIIDGITGTDLQPVIFTLIGGNSNQLK
jgi:hypothetical protein